MYVDTAARSIGAAVRRRVRVGRRGWAPFVATSLTSSEMVKYAANALLAMKIVFAREDARTCASGWAEAGGRDGVGGVRGDPARAPEKEHGSRAEFRDPVDGRRTRWRILGGMVGIVVFAHGSRVEAANEAVRKVARELAAAGGLEAVEAAFLELGKPDLEGAADRLAERGVDTIVVIPYFLTDGLHMDRDLPPLMEKISKRHSGLRIAATETLDGHPALIQALLDRALSGIRSHLD